jgi:serine/threonine-protein kinase RsbT
MPVIRSHDLGLRNESDVVQARQAVRQLAAQLGFTLVDQTKIVTAASELARNTVIHGKGGAVKLEALSQDGRTGLRLTFEDQGPGIPDVDMALKDGYTTGTGLGLGLGGSKRLCNEFQVVSKPGEGTRVTIAKWK